MMNACVETSRPFGVKTMVSLNAIMVDGTGMCGSCRVTVGSEIKFACVDGPDFDGHQVDFKELMLRQKRFKGEEAAASTDYAHVCNVEKLLFEQGKTQLQEVQGPGAARHQDARARPAGALAQLQGSQPRLLDGRRAGRGRALHHVQQAGLHRGLPGVDRHPALHPPPAGARHRRRAGRHQRVEPVPVGLRPRLPAGVAVRGAVRRRPQARVGGHRPARALRRRQRAAAQGRAAALRALPGQGRDRRLRPVGPGGGGRPRALRLRGHRLRGAARGRRRAAVRHPVVPAAARDHRPRGRHASRPWASSSRPTRSSARPSRCRS